jgi:hypothetical protein
VPVQQPRIQPIPPALCCFLEPVLGLSGRGSYFENLRAIAKDKAATDTLPIPRSVMMVGMRFSLRTLLIVFVLAPLLFLAIMSFAPVGRVETGSRPVDRTMRGPNGR